MESMGKMGESLENTQSISSNKNIRAQRLRAGIPEKEATLHS